MPKNSKKIGITQIIHLMKRWRSTSGRPFGSGTVAVYVGPDRRRFVVPARFMNFPVFASLLEMAEEELGFQPPGGLELTCDAVFFTWVVRALERDEERFKGIGLDRFVELFAGVGSERLSLLGSGSCSGPGRDGLYPLLQKTGA